MKVLIYEKLNGEREAMRNIREGKYSFTLRTKSLKTVNLPKDSSRIVEIREISDETKGSWHSNSGEFASAFTGNYKTVLSRGTHQGDKALRKVPDKSRRNKPLACKNKGRSNDMITMIISTILSLCGIIPRESFGTVELMMLGEIFLYPIIGIVYVKIRNRHESD